jgi:hypothetical protein
MGDAYFNGYFSFDKHQLLVVEKFHSEPIHQLGGSWYCENQSINHNNTGKPPLTLTQPNTPFEYTKKSSIYTNYYNDDDYDNDNDENLINITERKMIEESCTNDDKFNSLFFTQTPLSIIKDNQNVTIEMDVIQPQPQPEPEPEKKVISNLLENDVNELSEKCKEYKLFQYYEELKNPVYKKGVFVSYNDIYDTIAVHCNDLLDHMNETLICRLITNFVNRLILELIAIDKKGSSVHDIMDKFHELYLTSTKNNLGKNDYERYDYINNLIDKTHKQSLDIQHDETYLIYSQIKQRGRRRQADKLETPNEVDFIRCKLITAAIASDLPQKEDYKHDSGSDNNNNNNDDDDEHDGELLIKGKMKNKYGSFQSESNQVPSTIIRTKQKKATPFIEKRHQEKGNKVKSYKKDAKNTASSKRVLIYHEPKDDYRVFLKTFPFINDAIPRKSNHGAYLLSVNQKIRDYDNYLSQFMTKSSSSSSLESSATKTRKKDKSFFSLPSPQPSFMVLPLERRTVNDRPQRYVWRFWYLLRAISNMQCMPAIILKTNFQTKGMIYYCDYSNERIYDGEDVYKIELYENDIVRFRKWYVNKTIPNRPFENEELRKSVKIFLIKRKRTSPVSIFPTDFSPEYKSHYSSYFNENNTSTTTTTRDVMYEKECYSLEMNKDSQHVWEVLFTYVEEYAKTNYSKLKKIQTSLSNMQCDLFNQNLYNLISSIHNNDDFHRKMKTILDFIDYLIKQSFTQEVIKNIDNSKKKEFMNLVEMAIFKGNEYITLQIDDPGYKINVRNCAFLRELLFVLYKRKRNTIIQENGSDEYFHRINIFSSRTSKQNITDFYEFNNGVTDFLVVLFDYLFQRVD